MNMPRVTIGFGFILIVVGAFGAYMATQSGAKPVTAMIPAYFGIALLIAGMVALQEKLRMHSMHVAVLIGLIGFLIPGFMVVKTLFAGEIARPLACAMQGIMTVTCAGYVFLCVKSFIAARKARVAAE